MYQTKPLKLAMFSRLVLLLGDYVRRLPGPPPHFSRNSLDTLPPYATAYLDEDEIFVNPDGSLSVHGEAVLTQENLNPRDSLVGRVAIHRHTVIDPATNALESSFIADLTYVTDPSMFDDGYADEIPDDQEEANYWFAFRGSLRPLRAFLVPPVDEENNNSEPYYCGPPEFELVTRALGEVAEKRQKRLSKRFKKDAKKAKAPHSSKGTDSHHAPTDTKNTSDEKDTSLKTRKSDKQSPDEGPTLDSDE